MAAHTDPSTEPRSPLSRDRVLGAAVEVADSDGIASVTMRRLAAHLGVEAMSLYYHIANKDAVLDGMVDVIVAEIEGAIAAAEFPAADSGWQAIVRSRALTARRVLFTHPWAPSLIESRAGMSSSLMRYFEATLGILLQGGFSADLAHRAVHALGSRALGFNHELFGRENQGEFEFGLDILLDGLERRRAAE